MKDTLSPASSTSELDIPNCGTMKQSNITIKIQQNLLLQQQQQEHPEQHPPMQEYLNHPPLSSSSSNLAKLKTNHMRNICNHTKTVMAKQRSTVKPNISPGRKVMPKSTLLREKTATNGVTTRSRGSVWLFHLRYKMYYLLT